MRGPIMWLLVLLAALPPAAAAGAEPVPPFDAVALSDAELDGERGGFTLPGGLTVAIAATITTDVDGVRLLQSVMRIGTASTPGGAAAPRAGSFAAALPGLRVEHMIGQQIGSIVVNTGDSRVIDSQISIDLSLSNVQPLSIGSAIFRVQSLGVDAGILRATGG